MRPAATLAALFGRALALRCPACGTGGLFVSWLRMRDRCGGCGLSTGRGEEGYLVGAYLFNLIAAELLWGALFIGILVATWPAPPWDLLLWGGGALMLVAPLLFHPLARTLFLAFDLVFRPPVTAETFSPGASRDG